MDLNACPPISDLFNDDRHITQHLNHCRRCQALARYSEKPASDQLVHTAPVHELAYTYRSPTPSELEAGVACSVAVEGVEELLLGVLLAQQDDEWLLVPLSGQVEYATDWDLLVDAEVMGYEAMAEVWNHGKIVHEQIEEPLAVLPQEVLHHLVSLFEAAQASAQPPTNVPVGVPILSEDDPRILFQEREIERVKRYFEPLLLLVSVMTLGELVVTLRHERPARRDLVEIFDDPRELEALERDKLNLFYAVPVSQLNRLLTALGMRWSTRLGRLVRSSLDPFVDDLAPLPRAALARTRKRSRRDESQPVTPDQADAYVDKLRRAMIA